jgi:hypothetical protein
MDICPIINQSFGAFLQSLGRRPKDVGGKPNDHPKHMLKSKIDKSSEIYR